MPTGHPPDAEPDAADPSAEGAGDLRPRPAKGVRRAASTLAALILGGALVYSGWVAKREWAAEQIEAVARSIAAGAITPDTSARLDRWLAICGADCPARGAEAGAAAKAGLAARARGPDQSRLYDEALALTRAALKRSPISAEGWARLAMILSERAQGGLTPEVAQALRTSYSAAPFSRGSAVWRISFCAGHWPDLDPALRRHAADELVWLSMIDRSLADAVVERVSDPAAKFALDLAVSLRRD